MVDAGGLNPPDEKSSYRFESDPGHNSLSHFIESRPEW